ncbi:dihydrolipoamide acetyltransferase family protein [Nonomuraea zeae]|uniref:Dihydrolipoamide acetyltransferase component of pyruvate dehydrogenase complex n=1 Tax=Nonomuraea zeae TaxID=1642303 RepID=A0A5S4F6I1_9ACTN|nr:dihydrolipoamide acetyltransferase family protein [Nonomuraea zeae]TMR11764.1 2-oxo acid dehydrogenase subunit E2 [Nonomuraea zeae]
MARLLRMPEVAANAGEAVLQGWAVAVGAAFAAGDVIATVETDKAVVDVEAEIDGVLLRTVAAEGATVTVGTVIAVLGEVGEQDEEGSPDDGGPPAGAVPDAAAGSPVRLFSSPLARRLAREAGVPLADITGTGPNGRIIRRDVEAAIEHRTAEPVAARRGVELVAGRREAGPVTERREAEPVVEVTGRRERAPTGEIAGGRERVPAGEVPHSRARRALATRLAASKRTVPHFYLRGTAHVGELLKLRRRINRTAPRKVTVNDLVIKAVAHAHQLVPGMNVIWTPDATRSFTTVDVSVAIAAKPGELVTPVLRAAEQKSVLAISAAVRDFADRAAAGRLRQGELEGGVLTVTNLGMHGVEEFAAIVNPPQSAILAVGATRREPVVKGGKVKIGEVMRVTLSVDHRPVDGVVAAAWMREFLALLADPVRILA